MILFQKMIDERQHITGLRRYWLLANDVASRAFFQNDGARLSELKAVITSPYVIKVEKLLAGLHIIDRVFPGFERVLARQLLRFDRLPLSNRQLQLIGAGHGQNVFLFDTSRGKMVLKIDRESQGLRMHELLREARRVKAEYEKIRTWYMDIPGLVLEEAFCVVNGPLRGSPALATVQPYLEGAPRGFFEDFDEATLLKLLRRDHSLRLTFVAFARRVLQIYRETGECIDLLGKRNLCLLGNRPFCLRFTDAHDIYGNGRLNRYPHRQGELEQRLAQIERMLEALET